MPSKKKGHTATPRQQANESAVAGTSVANVAATSVGAAMPAGIVLKRRLTLPSLVLKKPGETRYLAIVDAMKQSKVQGKALKSPVKLEDGTVQTHEPPANICTVGDVMTGEAFTLLVPAVVKSVFIQEAPEGNPDWYVGKAFAITNCGKREGKRHIDFTVSEIDVSGMTAQAQS